MLEQLSSINWSDLSHAYGSAEDVPQLLRDLASPDEQRRRRAQGTLYTNIYYQGTVYQASAYAVPFLVELLRETTVPEREELLILLAYLAQGNTYHRQHWHFYTEERKQDPALLTEQRRHFPGVTAPLPWALSTVTNSHVAARDAENTSLPVGSREEQQQEEAIHGPLSPPISLAAWATRSS